MVKILQGFQKTKVITKLTFKEQQNETKLVTSRSDGSGDAVCQP